MARIETPNPYSLENPEDGCLWHALSSEGLALFKAQSAKFGKITNETTNTPLKDKRCIRCCVSQIQVRPWCGETGAVLAIPYKDLNYGSDCIQAGSAGDIHVLAEAALRCGRVWTDHTD